ncbi:MAG TPA: sugar phosphate isomerase/epimerase family protein [Phycisphaerae bacterium]|nr:sugar phosphate isomerase/epimerase [Phycisphaerae bacterium]HOB74507.1 sugar phosphate isomerase/epimerase family protein [Phycisphaerae bacterium]HOJ54223.1 sugar phosphate isomerase/epimerase family protein [Phycisphaerae bacterium]HOL26586.1 sugar phosphate isomerase/epimerase family protein [Phycisphaerae bacterium]HPP20320.1 sugar phosphate isomerase/epimerase family protein [Phycisphaerae bacterium]
MRRMCSLLTGCLWLGVVVQPLLAQTENLKRATATQPARSVAERASCSTLCLNAAKHPAEAAFKTIAEMGYRYIDLSALSFCRHIDVRALLEDFDRETARVEAALKANKLGVSNLTYDSFHGRPFDQFKKEFEALAKFAAHVRAPVINLMAPPAKANRDEAVEKLKELVAIARRHGVILTVETHAGQLTELPADALWLCRQVPGLGLTLDPSHYYAGPHQGKPFDELYPYVKGTGFRAGGMSWDTIQSPWGTGPIDFAKIVRDLEKAGYQGYYVSEYLDGFQGRDAVAESKKFLEWIKSLQRRQ